MRCMAEQKRADMESAPTGFSDLDAECAFGICTLSPNRRIWIQNVRSPTQMYRIRSGDASALLPGFRIWMQNVRLEVKPYTNTANALKVAARYVPEPPYLDTGCAFTDAGVFPYIKEVNAHKKTTCKSRWSFGLCQIRRFSVSRRYPNARYPVPRTSGRRGKERPAAE